MTFAPTATGPLTGTLSITDNNNAVAGSMQTVNLSGIGTTPLVSLSAPTGLDFGTQPTGVTSDAQAETVTNKGTGNLTISAVTFGGPNAADFAIRGNDTCTGATKIPKGTCTVYVTFTPSATGSRSASLIFTDNAYDSPQTVSLTGTGGPAVAVNLSPASASVALSGTQVFTATINNTTNTALNWYVNGVRNGNATQGTLTACSTVAPLTCTYTAPAANVPTPNPAIIKVASAADPTKFQTASVTVTDTIAVTLSPASASVALGGTQLFTATVSNTTNTALRWYVNRSSEWQRHARHADRLHYRGAPDVYLHGAAGRCPQPQPGGH